MSDPIFCHQATRGAQQKTFQESWGVASKLCGAVVLVAWLCGTGLVLQVTHHSWKMVGLT